MTTLMVTHDAMAAAPVECVDKTRAGIQTSVANILRSKEPMIERRRSATKIDSAGARRDQIGNHTITREMVPAVEQPINDSVKRGTLVDQLHGRNFSMASTTRVSSAVVRVL